MNESLPKNKLKILNNYKNIWWYFLTQLVILASGSLHKRILFHQKKDFNYFIILSTNIRGRSRAAVTSKMECFVLIVNSFQPLTIITKLSILDVAAALDPPLNIQVRLMLHKFRKIQYQVNDALLDSQIL